MSALPATAVVPLVADSQGVIRVRGSRITLDSIVAAFCTGATAEEIAQQFPAIALADVYLIIAHYLTHTTEFNAYLAERGLDATALQQEIETRCDPAGLRARLLARRAAAKIP